VDAAAPHDVVHEVISMRRKTPPPDHDNGRSSRERAYLHIQRKIVSGELRAGQSISELSLAKEIGISRTPIREALRQLVTESILEQGPNGGMNVVRLTRQDIIDLYELREALEMFAVAKAARQVVRKVDLDRLQAMTDPILALRDELKHSGNAELDEDQMNRFVAYDLGFHVHLMRMAANARILKVVNETRLLMRIFGMRRKGHTVALLDDIHSRHSEILDAVAKQDPERATRAISEHIELSQNERLADFDQWELETSLRETLPAFFDVNRFPELQ
jgi:DNA-binding GntR family transcriptional regulator